MPKTASERCRICAKLSAEDAISRHGSSGTGCWAGEPCHKRRSYYRNRDRYNQTKRRQYRQQTGQDPVLLQVALPETTWAELLLYRERVDAPLHAIGAELRESKWDDQEQRMVERVIARIEPIHTRGLKPAQIRGFMQELLQAFSGQLEGVTLDKFEVQKELSPDLCPIQDCLLHQ
ncbi:MAG: hypothetical protein HC936_03790 [Leptolyngbyaceae cyanobacterium SU_3_3]|nr:hypothetical protein [Leptolyngbyaceae cyanobacterium SU_3_3]